jgi:hypothetical protein
MNKAIVLSRLVDQKSVKKKYKRNLEKKEEKVFPLFRALIISVLVSRILSTTKENEKPYNFQSC